MLAIHTLDLKQANVDRSRAIVRVREAGTHRDRPASAMPFSASGCRGLHVGLGCTSCG